MKRTSLYRPARSHNSITLRAAVDRLLCEHVDILAQKQLVVDVDLVGDASTSDCNDDLLHTIERMLDLAIGRCSARGEINLSAVKTLRGLEIEVADSGPQAVESQRRLGAFHACQFTDIPDSRGSVSPGEIPGSKYDFFCARCPQGGLAWTVVIRGRIMAVKAA